MTRRVCRRNRDSVLRSNGGCFLKDAVTNFGFDLLDFLNRLLLIQAIDEVLAQCALGLVMRALFKKKVSEIIQDMKSTTTAHTATTGPGSSAYGSSLCPGHGSAPRVI
jgi:hypothetical protein